MDRQSPRDVPTFAHCVIGYRAWMADNRDQLWPLHSARRPWVPDVNTARCNCDGWKGMSVRFERSWHEGRRVLEPAPAHAAPDPDCECGLYSLRRPRWDWYGSPTPASRNRVVGAVASWGRMHVHDTGLRAEHARIVALGRRCDATMQDLATLGRIAKLYRVQLVPVDELEQEAGRYGGRLPDTLHPTQAA